MFVITCGKSGFEICLVFEISLVHMPKALQLWRLFCCQGLPDACCALLSGRYVHMASVKCWVWPTTPAGPGFHRLVFVHTGSMQHARKALILRGAQFDSFSLSQGLLPEQELHEWSQNSQHSYLWRVPGASRNWLPSVKKAHFVAGGPGATLCIYGDVVGPRGPAQARVGGRGLTLFAPPAIALHLFLVSSESHSFPSRILSHFQLPSLVAAAVAQQPQQPQ